LENLGRFLFLTETLFKNSPGLLNKLYLNLLLDKTSVTSKVPLYPILSVASSFSPLSIPFISTVEPTNKSCGSSVVIVATLLDQDAPEINLKFLNSEIF
jgi:hypothetical protein